VTEGKNVIREASSISVVLFDFQIRFVVEQAVENVSRVPHRGVDHLRVIWSILVGNMSVKENAGISSISEIDLADCFTAAAGAESLTIRG
jgi:hypothetical protein